MLLHLSDKEYSVLMQVYKAKSIPRADLTKSSKLKSASLYRCVDSLLKYGYLISKENHAQISTSPGRPSDLVALNPTIGYSMNVSLWRRNCHVALLDFSGKTLCEDQIAFEGVPSASIFNSQLNNTVQRLIGMLPTTVKLLGISIAIVGLLDKEGQKVLKLTHNPFPFTQNLSLSKIFGNEFDAPVIVNNITSCAAVGYQISHADTENMSYIFVDEGIANHTIIHGESLPSKRYTINGFGHMTVSLDGNKCECGSYGCLETYCSAHSIAKEVRSSIKLGMDCQLQGNVDNITFRDVCVAAQNGDILCRDVIRRAAAIFCVGLNNYIQLLPVDSLVFSGSVINETPLFSQIVQEEMSHRSWKGTMYRDTNIQDSVSLGCHTLLLQRLFSEES